MNTLSDDSRRLVESMQRSVEEALERKRRLGQYAVVWRDGRPAFIGPNPPRTDGLYKSAGADDGGFVGVRDSGDDEPTE